MGARLTAAQQTSSSDYIEEEEDEGGPTPAKRARLDRTPPPRVDGNFDGRGIQVAKGSSIVQGSESKIWSVWERLPYVALIEVFKHLSNNDKLNAGLTCRKWQVPFYRPALWRRGNFRFNGSDDWRAMCFVCLMGAALRHVTIDCFVEKHAQSKREKVKQSTENLYIFLMALDNSKNRQISTFQLTNLKRFIKINSMVNEDYNIIDMLTKILSSQDNLTSLDFDNAGLHADEAFHVLVGAAEAGSHTVKSLSICKFILPPFGYEISPDTRLLTIIERFKVLSELNLSFNYLSDDLLYLMAASLYSTLIKITVWANGPRRVYARTTPDAWKHLTVKCPSLCATYRLKNISLGAAVKDVLTPCVPLTYLYWNSGLLVMVDSETSFHHIVTHFSKCLRHLELNLHMCILHSHEDLSEIITDCLILETLTLTSEAVFSPQRRRVERAIRRAKASQPLSKLRDVTLNGESISLEETWTDALAFWLLNES